MDSMPLNIIALDEAVPSPWRNFAERWQHWRGQCNRHLWAESWQGKAWREKELRFPSPWSEHNLATRLSVRRGLVFAYVLQEGLQRALVIPGWLGGGHELEAVYLLREQVLLLLPCSLAPANWFVRVLAELLPPLMQAGGKVEHWPATGAPERPQRLILEGHPNYAHQLLNVLSALEDQEDDAERPALLWLGQQPFGSVKQLYPEQNWMAADSGKPAAEVEPGSWFELPLSQRPDRIPSGLRRRLRRFCKTELSAEAATLLDELHAWRGRGGRVLWVSLKSRGAWAQGLPKLVAAWMRVLKAHHQPLPLILLDGFSMQEGDSLTSVYYGATVATLLDEETRQAAALEALLQGLAVPVLRAIGLRLAESIALGELVDAYFCHQGTVQHKLGWVQDDVPGVVHGPGARNLGGQHPWGGLGGIAPEWFPASFCTDLGEGQRAPYRFKQKSLDQAALWLASCSSMARLSSND